METNPQISKTEEFTVSSVKDLAALNRELRSRMTTSEHTVAKTDTHFAENRFHRTHYERYASCFCYVWCFTMDQWRFGVVIGGLAGAIGTSMYYKGKIDNLGSEIDNIGVKLAEAEIAIKRAEESSYMSSIINCLWVQPCNQ